MNQKKIMKDTSTPTATTTAASVSATLKTWEPKTWNPSKPYTYSANSVKEEEEYSEDEYYEDDYDYDETDDEEFKKLSPLGIDPPVSSFWDMINYRFLTTETNLKALYIFCCLFTTSSVKLFVVNVHIFIYTCVFRKKEKQPSQNLSHFENESTF